MPPEFGTRAERTGRLFPYEEQEKDAAVSKDTAESGRGTRLSLLNRLHECQDDRSWQDFFDSYWKLIYSIAREAGLTDAEAQDVVQDVVVHVWKKMKSFQYETGGSFRGWLRKTTHWKIADKFRARRPREVVLQPADEEAARTGPLERMADPRGFDLESVWEAEWAKHILENALARVRAQVQPKHFQVYDCHVIKGWPAREVASRLRTNIAQVHLIKHRIGRLIRQEIRTLESEP